MDKVDILYFVELQNIIPPLNKLKNNSTIIHIHESKTNTISVIYKFTKDCGLQF